MLQLGVAEEEEEEERNGGRFMLWIRTFSAFPESPAV